MATDTIEIPFEEAETVRRGRLFRLKIKRSHAARQDSLATVRERPDGQWQARIGGRLRGETVVRASRKEIETEIHRHYNDAMQEANAAIWRSEK